MDQGFHEEEKKDTLDLYGLPEGCISNILSLTSPPDACRSSAVSSIFRSAAGSDSVWERFLPSDIGQILSSSVSPPLPDFSSKKELFLHLSDNYLLVDNGSKSFSLEKCSGKKCYMIAAKELTIIWGGTPKYWIWRPDRESRFPKVAKLLDVCWLEIRGKMEIPLLSPNTRYGAYLVFKLKRRSYGLEYPAEVSVTLASGVSGHGKEREVKLVCLNPERTAHFIAGGRLMMHHGVDLDPQQQGQVPKERGDGWMEIEMGEFFNESGEDGEVEMSLLEVKGGHWKSGLIIQGIELRPKKNQ